MTVRDAISEGIDWQQAARLPLSEFSAMTHKEWEPVSELASPKFAEPGHAIAAEDDTDLPEIVRPANGPRVAGIAQVSVPGNVAAPAPRVPDTHRGLGHIADDWNPIDTLAALPDLRPLGQLHESFIVATGRDGLWIIDQHVAHERILFEQVLRQRAAGRVEMQQLLIPVVLQLTPAQQFEYSRIADELNSYGFETEPFGQRTIAIKASPAGVNSSDIEKIIFEILEVSEQELRAASLDELRRNVCATIACRAAIKINTRLETNKMEWLLRTLAACEYPMTCPHGRPIALRYSTRDILKSFHRM